jgi:hypothetical protein
MFINKEVSVCVEYSVWGAGQGNGKCGWHVVDTMQVAFHRAYSDENACYVGHVLNGQEEVV